MALDNRFGVLGLGVDISNTKLSSNNLGQRDRIMVHVFAEQQMMFFDDNLHVLAKGNEFGERLSKVAKEQNILLMICDQCSVRRGYGDGTFEQCGTGKVKAKGTVEGVVAGCFPQLFEALSSSPPDQVITL